MSKSKEETEAAPTVKETMTIHEYADYKGVSAATIYKRLREGAFERNAEGTIDVATADEKFYSATSRIRITGTRGDEIGKTKNGEAQAGSILDDKEKLIKQRAIKEELAAEREAINLAKLKNTVVDKKAVEQLVFTISRQNSEAWLNWPNTISVELASELDVDPSLFHSLLTREVRKHLETIAKLRFDIESIKDK